MADEQTIYLSPEEELTSVRERLERTQARKIILVIPQQTQLRSHVGWRLIHARMRELGKELLVISPDRQVRAVARAAGFKVAETQEPSSSRPRLGGGSRPGNLTTRGGARSRLGGSRGAPQSQVPQSPTGRRRLMPNASNRPAMPPVPPTPIQPDYEEEATLERPPKKTGTGRSQPLAPATLFEQQQKQFGPPYDFHINTTPSVRPSVPHREEEEEEDDLKKYYEDYQRAQRIRESASGVDPRPEQSEPTSRGTRESRVSGSSRWKRDPYAYLEDEQQPILLPEQKGSVHGLPEEAGTGVPDISDRSTEIMESEIEDLGDLGAIDLPQVSPPPAARTNEQQAPPRPRPRTGQMPQHHSPRAPRSEMQDFNEDEDLLALPSGPVPPSGRPSKGLAGADQRRSQGLTQGAAPQAGGRVRAAPTSAPTPQRPPSRQLISVPGATRPPASQRRQRKGKRGLIATLIIVLLLLAAFLFFLTVPAATVTISLQAHAFSQNVQLNATADPHSTVANKVPAQILQHDFSASGQGTASGTIRVGNAKATGLVTFTNNGGAEVIIPTGTIIATTSGIQFATEAEAAIPPPPNNTFPAVPVIAQQAGESGNVPANSINVIPQSSQSSIAQRNHTTASLIDLAVSNPGATGGGGATNAPAVTTRDLQALVRTLHQKLQQEVTTWLKGQLHPGDMRGALVPDVLGSSGPLPQEQLSSAPGAGQAASSGTFTGALSLHISVLIARANALQQAAGAQLNAAAGQLRPASMLAAQLPVTLSNSKGTPSQDGNSLAITAKATGEIVRKLNMQAMSSSLTGKGISQVASDLRSSLPQAGIQNVQVSVFPGFLSVMPFQAGRIQIVLQPVGQAPPKNVPNG